MHPRKPRQGNLVAGGGWGWPWAHRSLGGRVLRLSTFVAVRLDSGFSGRAPSGRRRAPRVSRNASLSDYRAVLAIRPKVSFATASTTGGWPRARHTNTSSERYKYRRAKSLPLPGTGRPSRLKQPQE